AAVVVGPLNADAARQARVHGIHAGFDQLRELGVFPGVRVVLVAHHQQDTGHRAAADLHRGEVFAHVALDGVAVDVEHRADVGLLVQYGADGPRRVVERARRARVIVDGGVVDDAHAEVVQPRGEGAAHVHDVAGAASLRVGGGRAVVFRCVGVVDEHGGHRLPLFGRCGR